MIRVVVAVAVLVLAACTEHVQLAPGNPLPGLASLEVTPASHALALVGLDAPPQQVSYAAVGHFLDGSSRDVTELVTWTTDNGAPGTIGRDGVYTTTNLAAGRVRVTAASGEIAGGAALTVTLDATILDPAAPPPDGIEALFDAAILQLDPTRTPAVRYPSNDTMFPQDTAPALFQHVRGMSNDTVRLTFESDVLHLAIYTTSDRWQPDARAWSLLARSHPASDVTLVLDALAADAPQRRFRSTPTLLHFARSSAEGGLFYFSDVNDGVLRATLSQTNATPVLPVGGDMRCVGCHAMSRDGRTIAFGHGGETLATFDLLTMQPVITSAANIGMGWATFSPDGSRLLVADRGALDLRDAATGASLGRVPLPTTARATHPDWSPDGTQIAVALSGTINNMELRGGSIARIPYNGGTWGTVEVLVPSTGDDDNNYFPKWSPDGRFLAYVHADEPSRDAITAELRLIGGTGGTPISLARASHRVGTLDDVPYLATTMPVWAPTASDEVLWLAFASRRPYGIVRPVNGTSQIWVAAIDPRRTGDPSFAAFRLSAQDIARLNNGPVWTALPAPPTQ